MERRGAWLVVGSDGLIGRGVVHYLESNGEMPLQTMRRRDVVSQSRIFLDLGEDISRWKSPSGVSVAVLRAAVTSLEQCYREPVLSAKVNADSTIGLAKRLGLFELEHS